jgi:hypothetical protein
VGQDIAAEFVGVCHGVTADGWVSAEELWFIGSWLNEHPQALKEWPGSLFVEPLNRFFADGKIEACEIEECVTLLSRVEREWAEKRALLESSQKQETPLAKKRVRKTATPPPVPVLFDWQEVTLPSVDWQGTVGSFSGSDEYSVDLREPSCSCPDWLDRRRGLPYSHPAKACKHIVSILQQHWSDRTVILSPILEFLLGNAHAHKTGIFPADNYGRFEVGGSVILFSYGASSWMNVWAPSRDQYLRYGYNVGERRWSYGEKPKNSTQIVRVLSTVAAGG